MSGFGIGNLTQALAQHTRQIAQDNWQVGSGATTTSIPVVLRNPSGTAVNVAGQAGQDLVGATVEFVSGANIGSSRAITAVASNGTLTLDTALDVAPASGDLFVVIKGINVTATASENISQVGGTAQTGADWTTYLSNISSANTSLEDALEASGTVSAINTLATEIRTVAGTAQTGADWTTFFQAEADGFGAAGGVAPSNAVYTSTFPTLIESLAEGTAAASTTALLTSYTVPANGTINIAVAIAPGGTTTTFAVTQNGTTYLNLNNGNDLVVGALNNFSIAVAKGDTFNCEFGAATIVGLLETFFVATQ